MEKISIIVPCFNENETINIYYNEVIKYLSNDINWHIIFVNDGSKDSSLNIIKELSKKDPRVRYISFSRNFGKEAAMYAGLEAAKKINSDSAIIMDVDLQDPPYLIPKLLEAHNNGYNLIYTKQRNRHGASKLSAFFSLSFYKVYAFLTKDKGMAKGGRDFCLLDKKVIDAFLSIKDHERFTKGIYHYVGFKKQCIEFDYEPRSAGTTKWNFRKLFKYAFLGIREFSNVFAYIPKLFMILSGLFLLGDLGYQIYNAVMASTIEAFNFRAIQFDFVVLAVFITLYYLFKLIYDVRAQVQNRPIYIEEESNIDDITE